VEKKSKYQSKRFDSQLKVFSCVVPLFVIVISCVLACTCSAATPLPRIKARVASPYAEFYNVQTGESFRPIGSNYVQLYTIGSTVYHSTFIPGLYDSSAAENALTIMQQSGYNFVRVFCYQGSSTLRSQSPPLYSIEGPSSTNVPQLYQPYLNNLLDFLTRANSHGIYVQIVIDYTPTNVYYTNLVNTGYSYVTGSTHRDYMVSSAITAKQTYIRQLIQSIINYDPNLLSTVFSYELKNELNSTTDNGPFNLTSGWYTMGNGNEYDMSSATSRQACQDDNIKNWANKCVIAIREKDPNAMACASVFPFDAVGKNGYAGKGLLPITFSDKRWPARPSVLVTTNLDYVDIHSYLPKSWSTGLSSSEWSSIDKTLKPFTCGEFGAERATYYTGNVFAAAAGLYNYREYILDSGFRGASLFTWDTYSHIRWTAMEANAVINERLKPEQWSNWQFNQNGFTQFWDPNHNVTNFNTNDGKLVFDISGTDSYIYSPLTRLDTNKYRYFKIKLKNPTAGTQAQLFWITKTDTAWNETKSITFNIIPNSSDFKTYLVDLYSNPNWSGIVKQLRFDPADNSVSSGHYEIDYAKMITDDAIIYSDINEDNTVDFKDFSIIAQGWQQNINDWQQGDLNNDLWVDTQDIEKFAGEWLQKVE
jgi:hypothetical protein